MIYNERQYKITSAQLEKLNSSLSDANVDESDWVQEAHYAGLREQANDLKEQLSEYLLLKSGQVDNFECESLSSLPVALIKARIASGMTQKGLADLLGVKEQQIQRYEASSYKGANLTRLIELADLLGVRVIEKWEGQSSVVVDVDEELLSNETNWDKFPVKEMIKRGWLKTDDHETIQNSLRDYFIKSFGSQYQFALHRKNSHGKNESNLYSLMSWQARVLSKARLVASEESVNSFNYDDDAWVPKLSKLSRDEGVLSNLSDFLRDNGVILVVEHHLESTYLDGAAMLLDGKTPVIGLTLRYDRLDNFWFTLFHELGHIFLHISSNPSLEFFDEEGAQQGRQYEEEADQYALEKLISNEDWHTCMSRFSTKKETVLLDAERIGIHPSILAGRIRKEKDNYKILNDLVGQNSVRAALERN